MALLFKEVVGTSEAKLEEDVGSGTGGPEKKVLLTQKIEISMDAEGKPKVKFMSVEMVKP